MSVHVDVVEAARMLDELYEPAMGGEEVIITVGGQPRAWLERVDETDGDKGTD